MKLETLANGNVLVDGVEFVPKPAEVLTAPKKRLELGKYFTHSSFPDKGPGKLVEINNALAAPYFIKWADGEQWWSCGNNLTEAPEPEPAKIDVREYARQHRYWVAKEKSGTWLAYTTTNKKRLSFDPDRGWGESAFSHVVKGAGNDMYFNCTFPVVPWDKSLIAPDGSMPLLKPTPQRGDPVFVWDNCADDTIPAPVWYFHHVGKDGRVYVYSSWTYGRVMEQPSFENCRPFDAALVGVPRKDWPKAKEV